MTKVGMIGLELYVKDKGQLDRPLKIDSRLPAVALVSLRAFIVHTEHYAPIARHAVERRMYDTIQKEKIRAHIAIEVNQMVRICASCAYSLEIYWIANEICTYSHRQFRSVYYCEHTRPTAASGKEKYVCYRSYRLLKESHTSNLYVKGDGHACGSAISWFLKRTIWDTPLFSDR